MRGKIARELRKIANFHPTKTKREYENWQVEGWQNTLRFGVEGVIEHTRKRVPKVLHECVTMERKIYKHLKKGYKGYAEERTLSALPSKQELRELNDSLLKKNKQDENSDDTRND